MGIINSMPNKKLALRSPISDKTLSQLKRIRGQVDGIVRMYEEERACVDITRQIAAVRNSLARVARDMLTGAAGHCTREKDCLQLDTVLKELLKY